MDVYHHSSFSATYVRRYFTKKFNIVATSIVFKIIEVCHKCRKDYLNELGRYVLSLARVTWIKKLYAISIARVAWSMKVCHRSG